MNKLKRTFSLDQLQNHALAKGGKLISKDYINSTSRLLWRCRNGHKWQASALEIIGKKSQNSTWCPKCKNTTKLTLRLEDIEID